MNKTLLLSFFFLLPAACKKEVKRNVVRPDKRDSQVVSSGEAVVILDTTDLYRLPKDTGGEHRKVYKNDSKGNFSYFIYEPSGYSENKLEYPLLVFLHGIGERGTTQEELKKVITHGPPKLIEMGDWSPQYPFLVLSPQLDSRVNIWRPADVEYMIKYISQLYRVNKRRIYLTGLSLGGQGVWNYGGIYGLTGKVAALVPVCGSGNLANIQNLRHLPVWAFHGSNDNLIKAFSENGSVPMIMGINDSKPSIPAKVTIYPGVGHDSWTITYNGEGQKNAITAYDPYDVDLYDWMLQYTKD